MAYIKGKTLFFVTSPRSPMKMLPEIELLVKEFTNQVWNPKTQEAFMKSLASNENFEGTGSPKNLAFSARDRINRAPKALGFVDLSPTIQLTEAGANFLDPSLSEESLLRQMLKFQLPSPYHKEPANSNRLFFVKPYLEMFRLVYTLGEVTFDELMIFGLQLTDYSKFDEIVDRIKAFREAKKQHSGSYKTFMGQYRDKEIEEIYKEEIQSGNTKTRETKDFSYKKFMTTKARNFHDYADACFRYLRATGLFTISQKSRKLSIAKEKIEEVEYYLETIDRKPCFIEDEARYKEYLFNPALPVLYTDNRDNLIKEAKKLLSEPADVIEVKPTTELKKMLKDAVKSKKEQYIADQIKRLKSYKDYLDVMNVYKEISDENYYDVPLMLEWNTWRAMTMLDGGNIKANLKFDDNGQPLSTAGGNMADIVCDYGNFSLSVEVTTATGQRQYEMEGEPVSRHLAKIKKEQGKEAYCFFIAPKINESCIAHFFTLHLTNIAYYGGKSVIIPLELDVFRKMVEQSHNASYMPNPEQVRKLCEYSMEVAQKAKDEQEWYSSVKNMALNWLAA